MLETIRMDDVSVDMSFREFEAFADWCIRSEKPGFLTSLRLKRSGVWKAGELTDRGAEIASGLLNGRVYFNTMKYSASGVEQMMIWAGSGVMTCARRHSQSVRVWSADACELPAILGHFMTFVPRVTYSCGPYVLPAEIGTYMAQGNAAGLRLALGQVGADYEAYPPAGEAAVTPLSYGLSRELWELFVLQAYPFGDAWAEGCQDQADQSLIYLTVPESMYVVQGHHDDVGDLVGYDVSSTRPLIEWGRLVEMCGDVL